MPPVHKIKDEYDLISTNQYPNYAKFPFEKFNPVQSAIFGIFDKECNAIVAAKTSAGKTICAEMFMAHEVRKRGGKAMYLAPLRALAKEKIDDWTDPNHHFGDLNLSICTGDYRLTPERKKELEKSNVIMMTSEMLNSRCRNYKSENNNWLKEIGTIVVDECLSPSALISTDKGLLSIGDIIDLDLDVKVASFNHDKGCVEYKPIIARIKKIIKKKWHTIYYDKGSILVTSEHKVWVEGKGYISASMVNSGDVVYVIDETRKECNIRNFVGRLFDTINWTKQDISKTKDIPFVQTTCFSRVEVRKVEEIGWNSAKTEAKRWIWKNRFKILNTFQCRAEGHTFYSGAKWDEDGKLEVAESDRSSDCTSCLVHGRWKSREKYDEHPYRGICKTRSGDVVGMADQGVEGNFLSLLDEKILAIEIPFGGKGQVSTNNISLSDPRNEVQDDSCNQRDNLLLYVWETIFGRSSTNARQDSCFALWQSEMSKEMGHNVRKSVGVEEEDSYCCDLEIEDNNNFFADGVLVHNCHLLTVPSRGDHLEVGLMKLSQIAPNARFILLSATMPNVSEIAEWVSYSLTGRETYLLESEYRPCPLGVHYETYCPTGDYEDTENEKINSAIQILEDYPEDKFLMFVHTKRTGEMLKKRLISDGYECEFHNADLEKEKRHQVEKRFREGKLQIVVATSTLAWGLNLPARRVVIVGVHRGMTEVDTYDIWQMAGRAGRPGYDPRGDVYILVPDNLDDKHIKRLNQHQKIESRLLDHVGQGKTAHYKTLAFHLVSEIHHGFVKTKDDILKWYERSLAHFQANDLHDEIMDNTIESLMKCGAIKLEGEEYKVSSSGMISSMFYYSPYDVADLRRNFNSLFNGGYEDNDLVSSMCLGSVDSLRMGIVSKAERADMAHYRNKIHELFGAFKFNDAEIKGGYAYFTLMNGTNAGAVSGVARTLQWDFPRLAQVLQAMDKMTGKWNKSEYFNTLQLRVAYGVRKELVDLCKITDIGKVRAEKLWAAGIRNIKDVATNSTKVQQILNLKKDKIVEICDSAKSIVLKDIVG